VIGEGAHNIQRLLPDGAGGAENSEPDAGHGRDAAGRRDNVADGFSLPLQKSARGRTISSSV
jgi:hypothetical protein